jgi:hypothetical protein
MLQIDGWLNNKSWKNPSMWRAKLTFANNNTTTQIEGQVKRYVVQNQGCMQIGEKKKKKKKKKL